MTGCGSNGELLEASTRAYFRSPGAGGELSISHSARLPASVIAVISVAKMTFRSRGVHA